MTEAEWDACADPQPMLEFLRGRASDRKLRLFAVACCRRVEGLLTAERCREAVMVAERFADGKAGPEQIGRTWAEAYGYADDLYHDANGHIHTALDGASGAAGWCGAPNAHTAANNSAMDAAWAADYTQARKTGKSERAAQATLLRCVFGSPFRPPALDPAWLAWNDGVVRKVAAAIYDERRFADLPVLADALEDAGCADAAILAHCRGGGEHVRGCWVVDLLLGKS